MDCSSSSRDSAVSRSTGVRAAGAYSPVHRAAGGQARVELADDHPGVTDPAYRARRDALAGLALSWQPGQPVPNPDYTGEEHRV
ncbi:MAG: hypothetical protein J2P57_14690, partial [Acidimicrobiaceae bacterium]|nr:hypothetical protein [Acidimicrobiaceae bacterium]